MMQHAGSGIPVTIHPQMLAAMRQNPTFAVPYLHSPYAQAVPLGYVPGNLDPHLNKQILHQGATWTKSPDNERPKYKVRLGKFYSNKKLANNAL